MDSKLKCVFDYVDDGEGNTETSAGGNVRAVMYGVYHGWSKRFLLESKVSKTAKIGRG